MILFCGDTFLRTADGSDPFSRIKGEFAGNTVCINLETSLSGGRQKEKNVSLSVEEEVLDQIPESVRVINIVNNHTADGTNPEKLAVALKRRHKTVIGPANPSVTHTSVGGISADFFGAYFGMPRVRVSYDGPKVEKLLNMIRRSDAERKIVNVHWGFEHSDTPAPFQRKLAHRLIDAGADIIVGHHPHVPQGWETYRGKPIFYSLGNFNFWQFDGETSENNRWGFMVAYDLVSGKIRPVPYRISENYRPFRVPNEEGVLLSRLKRLSESLAEIDDRTWFETEYSDWYSREMKVWIRLNMKRPSPVLWFKWTTWMCMPIQLKYYLHTMRSRMRAAMQES